jgi:hypothetical protein
MTVRKTGAEHIKSLRIAERSSSTASASRRDRASRVPQFGASAASLYDVQAWPENLEPIDWNGATGLVEKLMSTYDLGGELDAGH